MTRRNYDDLKKLATFAKEATGSAGGAWHRGNIGNVVVCDEPSRVYGDQTSAESEEARDYYGGYLIAESIFSPEIAAFMARFHPAQVLELLALVNREQLPE